MRSARTLLAKCASAWNPRLIVTKSRPYSVSARSASAGSFNRWAALTLTVSPTARLIWAAFARKPPAGCADPG